MDCESRLCDMRGLTENTFHGIMHLNNLGIFSADRVYIIQLQDHYIQIFFKNNA